MWRTANVQEPEIDHRNFTTAAANDFLPPVPIPPLRWNQFKTDKLVLDWWGAAEDDMKSYTIIEHPLFTQFAEGRVRQYGKKLEALARPGASWRHCLVTQPPTAVLSVTSRRDFHAGRSTVFAHEEGVTLGEVLPRPDNGVIQWFETGSIRSLGKMEELRRALQHQISCCRD